MEKVNDQPQSLTDGIMKLIVCGGRNYRLSENDYRFLDRLHKHFNFTKLLSGNCFGADRDGELWAEKNGIPITKFIPDWVALGKKAGPLRNEEMAQFGDVCVCFPGGKGTRNMFDLALRYNLITIVAPSVYGTSF